MLTLYSTPEGYQILKLEKVQKRATKLIYGLDRVNYVERLSLKITNIKI